MNDRFKFRAWDRINDKWLSNLNCIEIGTGYLTDFCDVEQAFNRRYILMQCTGLKDKNGKLIYEGDIVKYAEFDWTDFSFKDWETEIAQVVWGNTYDNYYPAFDLKDTDFDGTNAFAYLFNEGWTVEVIGNIYQDSHLIEN